MASGGSDLSTRMSAEDENIENKSINDIALRYFKKYKVEISDAIKTTFPFLELLRDHEFITNEMYEESQESFKKKCPVHVVIYDVLCELEKKFDMSLLGALFSKTIMKNYPDLFRIYKIFYKAIPDIEFLLENDGEEYEERPNDQLSLEQGTGGSSYQRLTWLGPDAWNYNDTAPPECGPLEHRHDTQEINATETDTTSDNEDALKSQQANEQCAQESKTAGAELLHHGNQTNSCSVNPMGMKKEKSFLYSGVECEAQARTGCNQASDVIVINSQDFEEFTDEDEPPIGSTSALKRKPESVDFRKSPTSGQILCKTGAELLHQGNQNTSCSVNPMGIKKEKSFLYSGVECEAQARTDCNQASDVIVIDSQDFAEFTDEDGSSEASTTALKREPESMDFRKSPTSGKILCKTRAELLHQGNKTSSCSVDPVHIKEEKPCLNLGVKSEAQARTDCNQVSDSIAINRKDFTEGDGPSKASTSALKRKTESIDFIKSPTSRKILCKTGAELLHQGNKTSSCSEDPVHIKEEKPCLNLGVKSEAQARTDCNQVSDSIGAELVHHGNKTSSCSVDLVDIKKKMPFLYSGVECEAQARTGCNQASDVIEINSEDSRESSDGGEPPEASTSALKREPGTVDFGNNSISERVKKRRRTKMHIDETVDFKAEILPVTCGVMVGMLIKRKLKRGATVKCIRREDGIWFTPREFEVEGGYGKSSNWKNSVCCGGRTLKWLIQQGHLLKPPRGVKKKLKKAEKCKVCGDEGKLFKCSRCASFFHGDCHIPPVDPTRNNWKCTFCKIKISSRNQQQDSESEVLARPMRPEEKMKCEFLLLKAYCHFEGNIFPNIPHENYFQKASQCLETLRRLDEIKNSLNKGCYAQVEGFVLEMNNIFQDPKHYDSDLTEEEFKKNFKDVFAIQ
ncbi:nuclear autoantigen Sp-100-like isoform X5 [Myotis lucifugus]|uniref:nuclear autoantigen Sp-100-like isoform X5 n=1 Tax=Myotis lucifugus TaxID=59463 RepID=UPI000CCC6647|nr:nuclear autoantigen Sp-100-like isoform X5 [Myotis lucifugus]